MGISMLKSMKGNKTDVESSSDVAAAPDAPPMQSGDVVPPSEDSSTLSSSTTVNTSSSSITQATKPLANGLRSTEPGFVPMPVVVPQLIPFPVTKVVKEKVVQHKSYGIDPFSGKYVEL